MDKRLKDMASKIEGDFINLLCMKSNGFYDFTEGLRNKDMNVIGSITNEYCHKSILSLRDYKRNEYDIPTVVEVYLDKMSILSEYVCGEDVTYVGDEFELKDIKFAEFDGNVLRIVTDKKEFTLKTRKA